MEIIAVVMLSFGAAIVVAYIGTSYLLLKKPTLLHKKKRLKFHCRHISHRGGAGENIENTMTAFRHAAEVCQTDMLEIDCQRTADNQIVVSHDNHLLRGTGKDAKISDMLYKELPEYQPSLPLQFNGKLICESTSCDRRIPLLREVFQAYPNMPINIDIKEEDETLLEKVSEMIEEFGREEISAWGNFRDSVCQKCYAKNPKVPLIFSIRQVVLLCIWFYTGLLPFIPLKESCLEILMPSVFLHNPNVLHQATGKQRLLLRIIDIILMRPALFDHLHKRGIHVYAWVLNSEEEYDRAFRLGVDGVMTDFPSKLRTYLREKQLESSQLM